MTSVLKILENLDREDGLEVSKLEKSLKLTKKTDRDNLNIALKGKKVFTASDIQAATDQFEVLNKDLYITELNSNGKIKMELRIGVGKGYVPAEENELPNAPIGTLAVDSIFNPVIKIFRGV